MLPPELTDLIIDFVSPCVSSLKVCSLVCRTFRGRAAYHLFAALTFHDDAFERFLQVQAPTPRTITLHNFLRVNGSQQGGRRLAGVRELRLEDTGWLGDAKPPVGVRTLSIGNCVFFDYAEICAFLGKLADTLKVVKLDHVRVSCVASTNSVRLPLRLGMLEELELGRHVLGLGRDLFVETLANGGPVPFSLARLRVLCIHDYTVSVSTLRRLITCTRGSLEVLKLHLPSIYVATESEKDTFILLGHLHELEIHIRGDSPWWTTLFTDVRALRRFRVTFEEDTIDLLLVLTRLFDTLSISNLPTSAIIEIQGPASKVMALYPSCMKNTVTIL